MISELLPEDKRRLHELEQQLNELERGNTLIQPSDIYLGLRELTTRLELLESLAENESRPRRDDYRRRVQSLKNSHIHIKSGVDNFVRRLDQNQHFSSQRQELLGGYTAASNGNYDVECANENSSLNRSGRMLNEYIATGQETLSELLGQRDRLKGVQRKVLDIMNYLGLSSSIMRAVEKREIFDKYIVYAGMIIILIIIFIIWYYFRK